MNVHEYQLCRSEPRMIHPVASSKLEDLLKHMHDPEYTLH